MRSPLLSLIYSESDVTDGTHSKKKLKASLRYCLNGKDVSVRFLTLQMKGPKRQCILSRSRELLSEIKGSVGPSLPTTSVDSLTASAQLLVTPMDLWYQFSSYATPVSAFIPRAPASCCLTPPHGIFPPCSDTHLIGLGNPPYPNTISMWLHFQTVFLN